MLTAPVPQRVLPPEGTTIARLIGIIHIGTYEDTYKGDPIITNKVRFTFELPNETHVFKEGEGAKPFSISQDYTLSMSSKANLRKFVQGIVGNLTDEEANTFNIESLLGKACLITIAHRTTNKGSNYATITNASPLMKGMTCPPAVNELKMLTYDNWDEAYFNSLPDFIKDKMKTTVEYKKKQGSNPKIADTDIDYPLNEGDIPFD